MYRYVKHPITGIERTDLILRVADNAFIPEDINNRDWAAYQVWLSQGNTPLSAE